MAGLLLTSRSGRVAEGVLHVLFVLRVVGQERLMFKLLEELNNDNVTADTVRLGKNPKIPPNLLLAVIFMDLFMDFESMLFEATRVDQSCSPMCAKKNNGYGSTSYLEFQ